jgi:hypothetical protein
LAGGLGLMTVLNLVYIQAKRSTQRSRRLSFQMPVQIWLLRSFFKSYAHRSYCTGWFSLEFVRSPFSSICHGWFLGRLLSPENPSDIRAKRWRVFEKMHMVYFSRAALCAAVQAANGGCFWLPSGRAIPKGLRLQSYTTRHSTNIFVVASTRSVYEASFFLLGIAVSFKPAPLGSYCSVVSVFQ